MLEVISTNHVVWRQREDRPRNAQSRFAHDRQPFRWSTNYLARCGTEDDWTISNSPLSLISSDDAPTITRNIPGSTTNFMFRSHRLKSAGFKVNVTVFVSPGLKLTRAKPRKLFS